MKQPDIGLPGLKAYELYLFAPDGKVVVGWHSFDAKDDEAAAEIADGLAQQALLELWQGSTLVKRWEQQR